MHPDPATHVEAERAEHARLSPLACFSDRFAARPQPEDPDPYRACFVRDRDRVLHSGAFRRLKDKTQVFVIGEGDFYRTRLTHTIEVVQMARFLCLALRLNDTLGEVLAFVHDIGHPPFGHEGEKVLDTLPGVRFDHNRQALRIVDVLESPYPDRRGLNLTHAVRHSILKHGGKAGHGAPDWPGPLLEAQVVDLADSTAYQHHDLEDALRAGVLTEDMLGELKVWRQAAESVDPRLSGAHRQKAILGVILKTSLHDIVDHSTDALRETEASTADEVARQSLRLVRASPARAGLHRELAQFLWDRFYTHPRVQRSRRVALDAIGVIIEHYRQRPEDLPADYRARIDQDGIERSVCDYVAGMTDRFALDEWHRLAPKKAVSVLSPEGDDPDARLSALEHNIGYVFHDRALAVMSLTHSSARSSDQSPNERLEFLGDAVLGLLISGDLYERFPDQQEGELSRIKSAVVSRIALRAVARRWHMEGLLQLGHGMRTSAEVPPSIVANAVEAVLGAVFLDGGLEPVRVIVAREFEGLIERAADRQRGTNFKSQLQTLAQGDLGVTPHYRLLAEEGPDHLKHFTVAAIVAGEEVAVASGRNKREAEQRAARRALAALRRGRAESGATATHEARRAGNRDPGNEDADPATDV